MNLNAPKQVTVRVPATTANCGPGFDAIGMACSLYNEVGLAYSDTDKIIVNGLGTHLPRDGRNIAWQAVQSVFERLGQKAPPLALTLTNNIPLSHGLGSSAAAIVGGLFAANVIAGNQLIHQDILDMATKREGHPDNVAPAIFGGICISVMQTDEVKTLKFAPPNGLQLVAAIPDFNLPTRLARSVLPTRISMQDAVFNLSRTALLVGSLAKGELDFLEYALDDKLHQPYRRKLIPGMDDAFAAARTNGAFGATISGAGPTLTAYTTRNADAIGQSMVDAFIKNGKNATYQVLSIDCQGTTIVSE